MNPMMGGDYDNVDDYGNVNDIDDGNDKSNEDGSEVNVGGDTYDVDASYTNDVTIYHAAYTADADNDDVVSNANNDDTNNADNSDADENIKDGNNVGMDEVPMTLMMLKLIMLILDLKPNMV